MHFEYTSNYPQEKSEKQNPCECNLQESFLSQRVEMKGQLPRKNDRQTFEENRPIALQNPRSISKNMECDKKGPVDNKTDQIAQAIPQWIASLIGSRSAKQSDVVAAWGRLNVTSHSSLYQSLNSNYRGHPFFQRDYYSRFKLPSKESDALIKHSEKSSSEGQLFELHGLRHRTANHSTPDAVVYLPRGFDASKPINIAIYNHGLGSTVAEAFHEHDLRRQIDLASPNTVLILPEWSVHPGTASQATGSFGRQGFFRGMLQDILDRTPGLSGKNIDALNSMSIITHSGGYQAAMHELYNNDLQHKIVSVTLLDSLYAGTGFDKWLQENIHDLASGKKRFRNFFSGTADQSVAQARRLKRMLAQAGLPTSAVVEDYRQSQSVMDPSETSRHGIIFKYSTARVSNKGPHSSVADLYVRHAVTTSKSG